MHRMITDPFEKRVFLSTTLSLQRILSQKLKSGFKHFIISYTLIIESIHSTLNF
jgi:hypothetical protein